MCFNGEVWQGTEVSKVSKMCVHGQISKSKNESEQVVI